MHLEVSSGSERGISLFEKRQGIGKRYDEKSAVDESEWDWEDPVIFEVLNFKCAVWWDAKGVSFSKKKKSVIRSGYLEG